MQYSTRPHVNLCIAIGGVAVRMTCEHIARAPLSDRKRRHAAHHRAHLTSKPTVHTLCVARLEGDRAQGPVTCGSNRHMRSLRAKVRSMRMPSRTCSGRRQQTQGKQAAHRRPHRASPSSSSTSPTAMASKYWSLASRHQLHAVLDHLSKLHHRSCAWRDILSGW